MTDTHQTPPEPAQPSEERRDDTAPWAAEVPREPEPARAPEPPHIRVEEVEVVRVTRAETRGPSIEVPGTSRSAEPPPDRAAPPQTPPPASTQPPPYTAAPPPPPFSSSPPPAPPPPATPPAANKPSGFWVAVCHLAYLIPFHAPGLILTLLVWAWRRRRDPLLDDQGREALNFQLTYAGANLILAATCVGCIFIPILWLVGAVLCAVAAVSAADGQRYRYPFIIRLIK